MNVRTGLIVPKMLTVSIPTVALNVTVGPVMLVLAEHAMTLTNVRRANVPPSQHVKMLLGGIFAIATKDTLQKQRPMEPMLVQVTF